MYPTHCHTLCRCLAQWREFRAYLADLRTLRCRTKTLTALAGVEPAVLAQEIAVQGLQFFPSEAAREADAVTQQRIALILPAPLTAPHAEGVLVLDDMGDRKDGTTTDHIARKYPCRRDRSR